MREAQGHNHLEAVAMKTNRDVLAMVGDVKLRR
jgi:hypothetical protein